jgi:hypothetical protein
MLPYSGLNVFETLPWIDFTVVRLPQLPSLKEHTLPGPHKICFKVQAVLT